MYSCPCLLADPLSFVLEIIEIRKKAEEKISWHKNAIHEMLVYINCKLKNNEIEIELYQDIFEQLVVIEQELADRPATLIIIKEIRQTLADIIGAVPPLLFMLRLASANQIV